MAKDRRRVNIFRDITRKIRRDTDTFLSRGKIISRIWDITDKRGVFLDRNISRFNAEAQRSSLYKRINAFACVWDSMEPTIKGGSVVMVRLWEYENSLIDGATYTFRFDGDLFVKSVNIDHYLKP